MFLPAKSAEPQGRGQGALLNRVRLGEGRSGFAIASLGDGLRHRSFGTDLKRSSSMPLDVVVVNINFHILLFIQNLNQVLRGGSASVGDAGVACIRSDGVLEYWRAGFAQPETEKVIRYILLVQLP